jgi:dTDP-4-dehydrorhamnose reductase
MRLAIMGAGGQLGRELTRSLSDHDVVSLTRCDCDICDGPSVRRRLEEIRPTVVVNAAAFTRVDECEDNMATAFAVNAYAVRTLASVCDALGAVLVHVSTDYIFRGDRRRPYTEDDLPGPLNVYGISKVAGEYFVQSTCPRHFIVRTSGLYGRPGPSAGGDNFVETMLALARAGKKIRVVTDQIVSPTYTKDLARLIGCLLQTDAYGVYHVTNSGECSWHQFAERIFALSRMSPDLVTTTAVEFGAKARRPQYSVLAHRRLLDLGFPELRDWDEALAAYLQERVHAMREAIPC